MAINIIDISVKSLIPNPNNPRKDVGDVTELADSIKEQGLQQALVVTPDHEEHGERLFRVVIGHRRLAACKLAGIERVPCVVRELDAKTERELMLVENCQRSDLTPLEEADGCGEDGPFGVVRAWPVADRAYPRRCAFRVGGVRSVVAFPVG